MKAVFTPARVAPRLWNGEPAVLQADAEPWYHITCPHRVPAILEHGLSLEPPRRTFPESQGAWATIGGIYVTSGGWKLHEVTDFVGGACPNQRNRLVVALALRLPAGTRFCLDEDEEIEQDLPDEESREIDNILRFYKGHPWSQFVSCYLAWRLDQRFLYRYNLRVFDPPVILGVSQTFDSSLFINVSRPSHIEACLRRLQWTSI